MQQQVARLVVGLNGICLITLGKVYDKLAEQQGEDLLHHLAVGEHVGNTAWYPQVIFENDELAVRSTNQVGATDADVDVPRHFHAAHLTPEVLTCIDNFARYDPILQNAPFVVDIFQEEIESGDPLC